MRELWIKFLIWWLERKLARLYAKCIRALQNDALESQRGLIETGVLQMPRSSLLLKNKYNETFRLLKQIDPQTKKLPFV